jgi:hypothetical protein
MPVVNFLACLGLEQNISFLDRHYRVLLRDSSFEMVQSASLFLNTDKQQMGIFLLD